MTQLANLNTFFKNFIKQGDSLFVNTRKSIEVVINESSKDRSSLGQSVHSFGKSYDNFMIRFKNILK